MKKYKVVCVGAGYFAKYHVEAWTRIPDVELIAICDHDLEKAQLLAKEYQILNTFSSIDEAYEKLSFDIIDIITPPATHLSICLQAASHKKHIICQKPLAPSFKEAIELVDNINESKVQFMVHENFRFQPWFRIIKRLLEEGVIGDKIFSLNHRMRMGDGWADDAYLARQPYFREMKRFLIHETGIHFVDVFRYLLGNIRSVYARLRKLNTNIHGEDCAIVLFEFANGSQGVFDANRFNETNAKNPRYTFGEMLIEGNKGTIRLDSDGSIWLHQLGKNEIEIAYDHKDVNFSGDCVFYIQKHFIDSLQSGSPFETNLNDYLNNLRIQEAIYESAFSNKEIIVK